MNHYQNDSYAAERAWDNILEVRYDREEDSREEEEEEPDHEPDREEIEQVTINP